MLYRDNLLGLESRHRLLTTYKEVLSDTNKELILHCYIHHLPEVEKFDKYLSAIWHDDAADGIALYEASNLLSVEFNAGKSGEYLYQIMRRYGQASVQ